MCDHAIAADSSAEYNTIQRSTIGQSAFALIMHCRLTVAGCYVTINSQLRCMLCYLCL